MARAAKSHGVRVPPDVRRALCFSLRPLRLPPRKAVRSWRLRSITHSDEDQEALAKALRDWYRAKRDLDEGEMGRSERVAWKDFFKAWGRLRSYGELSLIACAFYAARLRANYPCYNTSKYVA